MLDMVSVLRTSTSPCMGIDIPSGIYGLCHTVIILIQVVVPILLIIWGMLDFAKAIIASDEDKIKAAQKVFIKRLIAALIVFLTVTIVKLAINLVSSIGADDTVAGKNDFTTCVDKFINGVR